MSEWLRLGCLSSASLGEPGNWEEACCSELTAVVDLLLLVQYRWVGQHVVLKLTWWMVTVGVSWVGLLRLYIITVCIQSYALIIMNKDTHRAHAERRRNINTTQITIRQRTVIRIVSRV